MTGNLNREWIRQHCRGATLLPPAYTWPCAPLVLGSCPQGRTFARVLNAVSVPLKICCLHTRDQCTLREPYYQKGLQLSFEKFQAFFWKILFFWKIPGKTQYKNISFTKVQNIFFPPWTVPKIFFFFFSPGDGRGDPFPLASFSPSVRSVFEITRLGKTNPKNKMGGQITNDNRKDNKK